MLLPRMLLHDCHEVSFGGSHLINTFSPTSRHLLLSEQCPLQCPWLSSDVFVTINLFLGMVTQILAQFTRQTGKQLYLHNAGGCELQGEVGRSTRRWRRLCLEALPQPRNYMIRLHGRRTGRNSTPSQRQGCFLAV